jgi:hypothetical protein
MIADGSNHSAPASSVRDCVQVAHTCYHLVPPERTRLSVVPGERVAVPLYDGALRPLADANAVLHYLGTVSVPQLQRIRGPVGSAASHRVALFRVIGAPGDDATVQVRLRLPSVSEPCESCRTVRFLIHVR